MKVYAPILWISLILLAACNSEVRENRLKRIDALELQLQQAETALQTVDTALAKKRIGELSALSDWVFEHERDTLNKSVGMPLGDLLRSKKYFERSLLQAGIAFGTYNKCRTQLAALRKDVQNDFYTNEEFNGYYDTEAKAVTVAITEAENLKARYGTASKYFDTNYPVVTAWMDSLKSVLYAPKPVVPNK